MSTLRFLSAGQSALLVELADLPQTLALFEQLERAPIAGVQEVIPAARTLLLHFGPAQLSAAELARALLQRQQQAQQAGSEAAQRQGRRVEIPVHYNGEDLEEVAAICGCSVAEVIERHTGSDYQAAFAGFAPGFIYLAGAQPGFQMPRRPSPRTRVPAGSVALGGEFSAVYPADSPGGWQLLGVTPLRMWDMSRTEPALVQPGFRVRFCDLARPEVKISLGAAASKAAPATTPTPVVQAQPAPAAAQIAFEATGLQTLIQDLGRPGKTGMGVSASGALDRQALREANRAVGNPSDAPVLENLLGRLRLRCTGRAVLAVAGADMPLTLTDAQGRRHALPFGAPVALDDGDVLELGAPRAGLRCYIAVRGGWQVQPVLDSCATDTLAQLGPAPLRAGDVLAAGNALPATSLRAVQPDAISARALPKAGDEVALDVVLGPRADWFEPRALALLQSQAWQVTAQSSRVGMRLLGEQPLPRRIHSELPSEGTALGSLQVPPNGQPVLFLADHPLTGGYPVIAVLVDSQRDLAAQIPPGARVRLRAIAPYAEVQATPVAGAEASSASASHALDAHP